jgi:hypothetical protein
MYSLALTQNLGFLCRSESYVENVSKRFFSETTWTIETKLFRNVHLMGLYKFRFFMLIGIPRSDLRFETFFP